MNSTLTSSALSALPTSPSPRPAAAARVLRLLERMPHGPLELKLPDGTLARLSAGSGPAVAMQVHDWHVFERTLRHGDIGLAEGFIDGHWDAPDLPALLRLCIANRDHIDQLIHGSWWRQWGYRLRHLLHRNTRAGSARNICAHYDLGNAFYRLWLDPSMSYSAAWFEGLPAEGRSLQMAQEAKMRRALREAGVQTGQRVLEIGCGWGAMAELAAREHGAHVTGITLSREQLAWAQARLHAAGAADRTDMRYQDYRDLRATHAGKPFDAIVSIEMFEAVGKAYWHSYFDSVHACLRTGGRACIQTITIRDDLFERYLRSTDFIQQYIFPGGLLPSVSAFEGEARRAGLVVENRLAFGRDYAETLRRWRADFLRQTDAVLAQGFDHRFVRIWEFYLCYCEAAFDSGHIDVHQFTLRKP